MGRRGFSREDLEKAKLHRHAGTIIRGDGQRTFHPSARQYATELIAYEYGVSSATIKNHVLAVIHTKREKVEVVYKNVRVFIEPYKFDSFVRTLKDYMEVDD